MGLQLQPRVDVGPAGGGDASGGGAAPGTALAHELLDLVERHRVKRLVIDGLEPLVQDIFVPQRVPGLLTAMLNALRARGVTSVLAQQTNTLFGPGPEAKLGGLETLVDNVVFLRYVELRSQLYRMLSILKMRESTYETALRQFTISSQGIDVAETFESAEAILSGQARPPPPKRKLAQKKPRPSTPSRRRSRE